MPVYGILMKYNGKQTRDLCIGVLEANLPGAGGMGGVGGGAPGL